MLFLRIDNFTKNAIDDDADPIKLMNDKRKSLSDINDLYRYTESLLMAVTDTALHYIKEQTLVKNKLNGIETSINLALSELKFIESQISSSSSSSSSSS